MPTMWNQLNPKMPVPASPGAMDPALAALLRGVLTGPTSPAVNSSSPLELAGPTSIGGLAAPDTATAALIGSGGAAGSPPPLPTPDTRTPGDILAQQMPIPPQSSATLPAALTAMDPTNPTEALIAAKEKQGQALDAATSALIGAKQPGDFANAVGQANQAIQGAGGDPTKQLGGNWGQNQPAPATPAQAAAARGDNFGAQALRPLGNLPVDPQTAALIGAQQQVARAKPQVDSAMAALLAKQGPGLGSPNVQMAPTTIDPLARQNSIASQADRQGIVNQRAMLATNMRQLEKAGLDPQTAALLGGAAGPLGGGGQQGGGMPWQVGVINPQLGQMAMDNRKMTNEERQTQGLIDSNNLMRRQQDAKDRAAFEMEWAAHNPGAPPGAAAAAANARFPPEPAIAGATGAAATRQDRPPLGAGAANVPSNQAPAAADPLRVFGATNSLRVDPTDRTKLLESLASHDEITNDSGLLAGVARNVGLTDTELDRLAKYHANEASNLRAGGHGVNLATGEDTGEDNALAAVRRRSEVIAKIKGALHPK